MASSGDLFSGRGKKLYALFNNFLKGTSPVKNNQDAEHFLEATDMICRHKTPGIYVESVVSSARGIEVLSGVVRSDLGPSFLAKVMKLLVKHLADPLVKNMNNGGFLQSLLVAILHPPAFWSALLKHHQASGFALDDAETFAWLCLEIVSTKCPELETPFGDVVALMDRKALLQSTLHPVRQVAYRIEKVLSLHSVAAVVNVDHGPGGRHDNDFSDFRAISLFPTADEIRCKEIPFLQRFDDVFDGPRESRAADYLSWLFRLLREDMLAEMREDLAVAWGQKTARRKPFWLGGLSLLGFGEDSGRRHDPLVLRLKCRDGIVFPRLVGRQSRKKFLEDSKSFMRHKATGVFCRGDDIVAFGSVVRNIDLLLTQPPTILIKLADVGAMQKTIDSLLKEATCDELRFFVVNTATFAYEPILQRLKEIIEIPLEDALLQPESATSRDEPPASLAPLLRKLERGLEEAKEVDLTSIAKFGKPVRISGAQLECLINGLKSRVGQIQGPPGTGKSFIGALILIIILNFTDYRVLVLSYTNHALDQFLEELMDFGVSKNDIVRLGSKSTPKTDALRLYNQFKSKEYRFSIGVHAMIKKLKAQDADVKDKLIAVGAKLAAAGIDPEDLLAMLELSGDDGPLFWTAFQVPIQEDGFRVVGKNNKPMEPGEILDIWIRGDTSPTVQALVDMMDPQCRRIWEMPVSSRTDLVAQWCSKLRRDQMDEYCDLARLATKIQQQIDSLFDETKRKVFRSKRVIGCTTTAAAMYQSILASAEPDLVLVEEAGEILEAHIVTALGPSVKKLVLIGDHKQLRPKVNSYDLTVEKGDGYNLNVSLFERLIQQGHAYTTLREQHRSHPDISHFTRRLAYEHLQDHPKTSERQKIRGLKGRVIFVHHEHQEDKLSDGGESARGESKKNPFEAKMVLKTVRYLGQQGYKSKNMVVLTPYLGQLSLLKSQLSTTHDPWLDDLDSNNLVQAGLMTEATAQLNKEPLRLSTIDNYQGEESDIVIASLTRSNDSGDIGFMAARERLVVLVSRAREGIVLFGNMNTFIKSKKGGPLWLDFFQALKEKGCLFDGVPVYCPRHPNRTALLKSEADFDRHCPDGGCSQPCGTLLSCGKHTCTRKCHQVKDHSKVPCHVKIQKTCERGHKSNVICSATDEGCGQCAREDEKTRRRAAQDLELETLRHERQAAYARQLDKIDDDIDHCERVMAYESEDERQRKQIEDKKAKLKGLQETQKRRRVAESLKKEQLPAKQSMEGSAKDSSSRSPAQQEWEAIRSPGDLVNDALDKLMDLIGLESVKEEFLAVKSNIDTKIRQGVSLSEERLSCSLLGNPGTGKTTVARLWGEFLACTGVLPGNAFQETTGSKLANMGVSGCEKLLEDLKNNKGGVLFIDEAYQLSSGNNPQGKAVLDYLLAEVENLRGKVSFIVAGYREQMETFFAHNPGFPSRFPIEMRFNDYSDDELLQILQRQVERRFQGRMNVEGGPDGQYFRIAARRIGRGRGKEGFGNARAVENALAQMEKRQSKRLRQERLSGGTPDDNHLTKEDIIGPEPSATLSKCEAWQALNDMIGLDEVKQQVKILLDSLTTNYQRELRDEPLMTFSLNRVFIGSPGTGKTTVAKLYGQILALLGMLSNGEVVVKTPADFIGSVLGQSEALTKGILASTVGKVLVIDEAYGLRGGGDASGSSVADPYRTAVVDTIVAEVQNVPGEDRCVILLGYKDQMEEMFQNVNPGLSRRFAADSPFVFQDFDDDALLQVLNLKLKHGGFSATEQAKKVAIEILVRERNRPNFGNGGAVDNLLSKAKSGYQKRASAGKAEANVLEAIDFDADFDRSSATDIERLFAGDIGRGKIVALLKGIQNRVRELRELNMDLTDEIPFNFLFRGPPGTGKTTTARKMGKVYYDMGFLSAAQVVECSATDLIGQYVGQTGPKVQQLLNKALGKVLFIDEAYRLAGPGFAKEAVDELVDSVTKEKYKGKLIIILAGYVKDINHLLLVNPGMTSRFPETIDFEPLSAEDCLKLLTSLLSKKKLKIEGKGKKMDIACLESRAASFEKKVLESFRSLARVEGWASARDVEQLARNVFRKVDLTHEVLKVEEDQISQEMIMMLRERSQRERNVLSPGLDELLASHHAQNDWRPLSTSQTLTSIAAQPDVDSTSHDGSLNAVEPELNASADVMQGIRDAGVSDEVWEQLQRDRAEEQRQEEEYRKLKEAQKSATGANRERIVKQLIEEERRRRQEEAKKAKLMALGSCPAGYQWIRQSDGYRCAGGSHAMSDKEVSSLL